MIIFIGTEIVIAGKVAETLPPPYVISATINGTENEGDISWWCGTETGGISIIGPGRTSSTSLV